MKKRNMFEGRKDIWKNERKKDIDFKEKEEMDKVIRKEERKKN